MGDQSFQLTNGAANGTDVKAAGKLSFIERAQGLMAAAGVGAEAGEFLLRLRRSLMHEAAPFPGSLFASVIRTSSDRAAQRLSQRDIPQT